MVRYITINGSWSSRTSVSKNFRTSSGQATPLMKRSIFSRRMENISAFQRPIRGGSLLLSCTIDEKYAFLHKPWSYGLAQAWEISGPGQKPFRASQVAWPSLAQESRACPGSRPKATNLHRIKRRDDPFCEHCPQTKETVRHYILECPARREVRRTALDPLGRHSRETYHTCYQRLAEPQLSANSPPHQDASQSEKGWVEEEEHYDKRSLTCYHPLSD